MIALSVSRPVRRAFPLLRSESSCRLCGAEEGYLIGERDREGRPLRTILCAGCTLIRTDPLPSLDEERRFYEGLYRERYKGGSRTRRRHCIRETLNALRRHERLSGLLFPGIRMLDVGCGPGFFPFVLAMAGYPCSGIEPDPACVRFAREELGLSSVRRGRVEELDERDAYDLITLHHVLEHLCDPLLALSVLRRALKPGGRLLLEVPTLADPRKPWPQAFHRAHLFWWDEATLRLAAARSGFALRCSTIEPDTGHLAAELVAAEVPRSPALPSPEPLLERLASTASHAPARKKAALRRSLLRAGEFFASLRPLSRRRLCERLCALHLARD